jgi:ribonuclease HI
MEDDELIFELGRYIGKATNNIAKYSAVLEALLYVKENVGPCRINHYLGSELVTKQLNGKYKIKDQNLKVLYLKIRKIFINLGGNITFTHIRREKNSQADKLVNDVLGGV